MDRDRSIRADSSVLRRSLVDLIVIGGLVIVAYLVVADLDLFEQLHQLSRSHEDWELDEIFVVIMLAIVGSFAFGVRRLLDQRREIKARIAAEDEAIRISLVDPLTGLANRRGFEQHLGDRLAKLDTAGDDKFALLLVDLDHFKPVNDAHGHVIGDEVLREFAKRTSELVRSGEFLARLAGDEFGIVMDGVSDEEPRRLAERLLSILQFPVQTESGTRINLGASIGIAMAPRDGIEPRLLFKHADDALYQAKESGRRNYKFHCAPSEDDTAKPERLCRAC